MKIKNLLLLGLLTMSGIEAFAADAWTKVNGVVYKYNDAAPDDGATVEGVLAATDATTVSIEAAITYPEDPSKKLKVIGFDANWSHATSHASYTYQDVRNVTQNLSVDVSNLTGMFSDQAQSLTSLNKLTLSGEYTVNNYRLEGVLNTSMTELDLSGLKGHEKVLIAEVDDNVQKITLPTQQPVEILTEAFKDGGLTELTIPSNVTVIAADAFGGTAALATLTITNDNITAIADDMFKDSPIASLSITAKELTSIGANAFAKYAGTKIDLSKCPKLKTVSAGSFKANPYTEVQLGKLGDIPGTAIDQANFEKITGATGWLTASANSLETLTLPAAITTIPAAAFKDFKVLKGIAFPDALTEIKENAFNGCIALEAVALNKVEKIGASAFEGCNNAKVTALTIPATVTTVGADAFKGMTSLAEVTVIGNFDDLGAWFAGDDAIKKITIPAESKVKKIKEGAFIDAAADNAEVTIKAPGLTVIEKNAFQKLQISSLTLYKDVTETALTTIGDNAFAKYKATTIDLSNCKKLTAVSGTAFPNNVLYQKVYLGGTLLNNDNFANAQTWLEGAKGSLTEITLPETITEIGGFAGFTALPGITLPASVKKIKDNGFNGSGLKSIDLSNVENIGESAFENCTNFNTTLAITPSVKSIGANAFKKMTSLQTVTIKNDNLAMIDAWFAEDAKIKSLTIEADKLATIATDAFKDAEIETLDIKKAPKLATIASNAFASVKITEVNFNDLTELANVADNAFKANAYTKVLLTGTKLTAVPTCFLTGATASLEKLGLPEGMTVVAGLGGLTKLKSIDLPKKATTIANNAFKGCTDLGSIVIPAKVTSIGISAFEHTGLTSVDFSAATALETIGNSAFASTQLTDVEIPATLAVIDENVFANNAELANVDFSKAASLTEIKAKAFNNDPALTTLNLDDATKLTTIDATSFPANAYTSIEAKGSLLSTIDPVTQKSNFNKINLSAAKTTLEKVTLPDGLTKVDDGQFKGFTALKSIGLPKAVTVIGKEAFMDSGLEGIKIKENVKEIQESAFKNCKDLVNVNMSEAAALTDIGVTAFENDAKLTTLAFPANLKEIHAQAFAVNSPAEGGALESLDFSNAAALTTIGSKVFYNQPKLLALDLTGAAKLATVNADAFPQNKYTSVKTAGTALTKDVFNAAFSSANVLANAKESLTEITFPKGYDVSSFVEFGDFKNLATVALPEGITEIPAWAFDGAKFTSFTVPATVTKIGTGAFQSCKNLANVDFSQATALTEMGGGVFAYCDALKSIGLPKNLQDIPESAFTKSGLESIKIKGSVKTIGESAFQECAALATVNFSEATALTEIGTKAFADCPKLTAVDFAGATKLEKIGDCAFYGDGLTTVKITSSIKELENQAFYKNDLESIDFTEASALTTIGTKVFNTTTNNSKLTVIDLDGATALTSIASNAFPATNEYTIARFAGTKLAYTKEDGTYVNHFTDAVSQTTFLANSKESLTELTFPDGFKNLKDFDDLAVFVNLTSMSLPALLTVIPEKAFENANITSFVVPAAIVKIEKEAFKGSALKTIDFSQATAENFEMEESVFENCAELTAVGLPKYLKVIPANAFLNSGLESIRIKSYVEKIDQAAFKNCANLAKVNFEDATALTEIGVEAFENDAKIESLAFPAKLEKIGNFAFNANPALYADGGALETLDFSKAAELKEIGTNAFNNQPNLLVLDLDGATSLTTVANDAFPKNEYTTVKTSGTKLAGLDSDGNYYDNFSGTPLAPFSKNNILAKAYNQDGSFTITLPAGYEEVVANQFQGWTALKSISLPKAVKKIGAFAFQGSGLEAIKIRENVTEIGNDAFEGCVALGSINFSEATSLKKIGNSAFANCYAEDAEGNAISGLTAVAIPGAVTTIDPYAFAGCKSLADADFSQAAELKSIGASAFAATAMTTIDLSACPKLAILEANAFPGNAYTSVKLSGTILDDTNFQNFDFSGATATLAELTLPGGIDGVGGITYIPSNWFGETKYQYTDAEGTHLMPFSALKSLSLPKTVKEIKSFAFQGSGLTAFKVRENVEIINNYAFEGCEDLATVNFSEATALRVIGKYAFSAAGVKEVAIPANADDKPLTINEGAFADSKLKSFSAKSWEGNLADKLFQNTKLTGIVIPAAITGIGAYAFDGCKKLETVSFKHAAKTDKLNFIDDYAFRNCEALTALDLSKTKLPGISSANAHPFEGCFSLATITFPKELTALGGGGLFADTPIENFVAEDLVACDNLFGMYLDRDEDSPTFGTYQDRDAKNPNTTLKTVKMNGDVPSYCFAYCTALETVEWYGELFDEDGTLLDQYDVDAYAFDHCTGLKTFTFEPENDVISLQVDNDAFLGCVPFVLFATNSNYIDYVELKNDGNAPVNTTFGDVDITKVQTVQDKANASQFIAKYVNNGRRPVAIDANDAKVYSIYVDGDKAYYQALRTYDGKYIIQPQTIAGVGSHVIIKTEEAKEVAIHRVSRRDYPTRFNSIAFDDVYDSQASDDLAAVQAGAGVEAGSYLYRLTNTTSLGFGFTFFTGTTIKAGQFFIACSQKPNGAGRLEMVWLDEDGNVEGEATGIEKVKNIDVNNGAIYNLQGVRVDNPVKGGLYIQNGKKIVVK